MPNDHQRILVQIYRFLSVDYDENGNCIVIIITCIPKSKPQQEIRAFTNVAWETIPLKGYIINDIRQLLVPTRRKTVIVCGNIIYNEKIYKVCAGQKHETQSNH